MKTKRIAQVLIAGANLAGIVLLFWLGFRLLRHDTTVLNPDAMLPAEDWDGAGSLLLLGLPPMIAANAAGFLFLLPKERPLWQRLLLFLPAAAELVLAGYYLLMSAGQEGQWN